MSDFRNVLLGQEIASMDVSPDFVPYSRVEILTGEKDEDGHDIVIAAGNQSGRTLTIENPWGTQEQANAILANLQGFTYRPYTATGALLNPAAEIGDGVTINGIYSGIYKLNQNYSPLMQADIEAPEDEEIDHEYPYEPKQDREYRREIEDAKAQISMTSQAITAEVMSKSGGEKTTFGWNLTDSSWELYSNNKTVFKATSSGVEVSGKITATSGSIGGITIASNAIYTNGKTGIDTAVNGVHISSSGISLGNGAFKVTNAGVVTAKSMRLQGTITFLNADGTSAGTLSAAALRSGARSAYNNGSSWTTGATRAAGYYNATLNNTSNYPSYFTAGTLTCSSIRFSSASFDGKRLGIGSIPNGSGGYWQVVTWS